MKLILSLLGINSEFERLFYVNEYKTLAGEQRRTILALILILFLTLIALSYAVGSIQNLEKKMDNPYTNWVDLSITDKTITAQAGEIQRTYTSDEKKEALQIDNVRGWVKANFDIYHSNFNPASHSTDTLSYGTWGRTLEEGDVLLKKILSDQNLIWKNDDFDLENEELEFLGNCEFIVSKKLLLRLGYDPNNIRLGGVFGKDPTGPFYMNVVAVVNELPGFCDFICSPEFYNIYYNEIDGIKKCGDLLTSNDKEKGTGFNFIIDAKTDMQQLKKLAKEFLIVSEQPEIRAAENYINGANEWSLCEFAFLPSDKPSPDSIQAFLEYSTKKGVPIADITTIECSTEKCSDLASNKYHYLAFNFNRLNDIRNFKNDLKDSYDVDIDMTLVEAKENFALVGRLTLIISLILLGFGILSIILFVNNLLKAHLFKVRSNLGTFKAFGLSNRFLNTIYLKIIFSFLILSILIAFGFAIIVDRVEQLMLLGESQFNVFSPMILLALIGLVLISLFISFRTIKRILGDTPGNLIYER